MQKFVFFILPNELCMHLIDTCNLFLVCLVDIQFIKFSQEVLFNIKLKLCKNSTFQLNLLGTAVLEVVVVARLPMLLSKHNKVENFTKLFCLVESIWDFRLAESLKMGPPGHFALPNYP